VELPPNREAIEGKYVFKIKDELDSDNLPLFKVRFVGKGFQQIPGIDFTDTYIPTLRMISLRLFLTISATNQHTVRHFDVDTAFLNADLKEEIYIHIPPGAHRPTPTSVWRLHKALYGLKQANRGWKEDLTATLQSAGYQPTTVEPCLYIHADNKSLVCHHVDDILSSAQHSSTHNFLQQALSLQYSIKDFGLIRKFVGIDVQTVPLGTFQISQSNYINKALLQFGLANANTSPVPLSKMDNQASPDSPPFHGPYKEAVGTLIYAMVATRPDISLATSRACSQMSSPTNLNS
jgi:hypothetical protein